MEKSTSSSFLVRTLLGLQALPSCVLVLAVAALLPLVSGCGGGADSDKMLADLNDSNVKRIANLYHHFQVTHNFEGPADEQEFRKFIDEMDPQRLKLAGIDGAKLDELFVSERDNAAFKIRYGLLSKVRGPSLPVVFEATGFEDKFLVGFTNGSPKEVSKSEYDKLWQGDSDDAPVEDGRPNQ